VPVVAGRYDDVFEHTEGKWVDQAPHGRGQHARQGEIRGRR
jgi:hypothetical protein